MIPVYRQIPYVLFVFLYIHTHFLSFPGHSSMLLDNYFASAAQSMLLLLVAQSSSPFKRKWRSIRDTELPTSFRREKAQVSIRRTPCSPQVYISLPQPPILVPHALARVIIQRVVCAVLVLEHCATKL